MRARRCNDEVAEELSDDFTGTSQKRSPWLQGLRGEQPKSWLSSPSLRPSLANAYRNVVVPLIHQVCRHGPMSQIVGGSQGRCGCGRVGSAMNVQMDIPIHLYQAPTLDPCGTQSEGYHRRTV